MKYRKTWRKWSLVPTTFGRVALRSSAAWHQWQTMRTNALEEFLSSLADQLPEDLAAIAFKRITYLESVQRLQKMSVEQWYEDIESCLNSVNALQMFSGECSGPH